MNIREDALVVLKKALKDWRKPIWYCNLFGYSGTLTGFCVYFIYNHTNKHVKNYLLNYFKSIRTTEITNNMLFNNRKERIKAVKEAIKHIELLLKRHKDELSRIKGKFNKFEPIR